MHRSRIRLGGGAALLLFLILPLAQAFAVDGSPPPGWILGKGEDLPGRIAVSEAGGEVRFRHLLPPGRAVRYDLPLRWNGEGTLKVALSASRVNRTSLDYAESTARFPSRVTVVFGDDTLPLGWRRRVSDFFGRLLRGFPPSGIRLTYAIGNRVPVGSMYRLHDEETVFLLGGENEAGKSAESVRLVRADFIAAYGREPKGPVTLVVVGGERPSREDGGTEAEVRLSLPDGVSKSGAP